MAKAAARRAGSTSHVWGYVIVLAAGLAFISSMYVRGSQGRHSKV
jgi:hypothetical protein